MNIAWRKLITEINNTSDRYLLCVSGGVDSMFMLDFFGRNCRRPFRVAHFNHGLRDISTDEENMVRDVCAGMALIALLGMELQKK